MIKICEESFGQLIEEDLEWLNKQEDSLERQHIEAILNDSSYCYYHKISIDRTEKYLEKKFGKEISEQFRIDAENGIVETTKIDRKKK